MSDHGYIRSVAYLGGQVLDRPISCVAAEFMKTPFLWRNSDFGYYEVTMEEMVVKRCNCL